MKRAAIYCRISRDRIGAGLGVERQETDCRRLAERLGLAVVTVLVDNDISAYSGKARPGYRQLLDMISAGELDAVIAWHGDRLHRSVSELEGYITACEQRDVPTYTATAGELDLTTATGRMHARIAGAVARHEVEHSIERQRSAKLQRANEGKWGGGRRPFGYESDGVTVRPQEARVVAEATDVILLGGSLRAQAASLNAAGVLTSTGRAWTPTELRKVLIRPRNAGLREHRGAIIGKATWPALVPEEKWRAIASLLTDPARRTTTSGARRWLLSGLATCEVCGSPLIVSTMATTQASVPSYVCRAAKHVVRNAAELEDYVSAVVIERLKLPDAINLLRPTIPGIDIAALTAEETNLQQRLDALADNLDLDERMLARRSQKLRERLDDIAELKAMAGRGNVLSGIADSPDPGAAWERLDLDRRRAVIDVLIRIVVKRSRKGRPAGWKPGRSYFDPTSIDIEWKLA